MVKSFIEIILPLIFLTMQLVVILTKIPSTNKPANKKDADYKGDASIFWLVITLFLNLSIFNIWPIAKEPGIIIFLEITGSLLVITGVATHYFSFKTLGGNWAGLLYYQIKEDQRLVTSGPYKFVRHPAYFGLILTFIGYLFLLNSYLLLAISIALTALLIHQATKEENLLITRFPQKYRKYIRTTRRIFPGIY